MILYFDRNVGIKLPQALITLGLRVEYHQTHFPIGMQDDQWLAQVGIWGWTVIGHDSKFHLLPNELSAIKQYNIGCFYLWGAEAPRWEKLMCLARAFDRIVEAEANTVRPFIYTVSRAGRLKAVPIP